MALSMSRASLQHSRSSSGDAFAAQANAWQERMQIALARRLPPKDETPASLNAALRSWVLNRADRRHSILMFAVGHTVGLREEQVEVAACALELLHLFVEAHRVLPALAGGERSSTEHPVLQDYDEATLLLVGDSLAPLALSVICVDPQLRVPPLVRLQLAEMLTSAIGSRGTLGAQMAVEGDRAAPANAHRSDYCIGVRLASACQGRPPGRRLGALLADFERALTLSWAEAYAVLASCGAEAETLRRATRWLIERENEGERDERA